MDEANRLNGISRQIIGGAIEVHRSLGPGLLESAYEACLAFELAERGLGIKRQSRLPLVYKGVNLDAGYRKDILVEERVVVEVKAVQSLQPVHVAQLLSYLRLSGCCLGLLINFNARFLKDGIRRVVHEFPD
jgi:GxxExxY protein